jgi:hypothetical protein
MRGVYPAHHTDGAGVESVPLLGAPFSMTVRIIAGEGASLTIKPVAVKPVPALDGAGKPVLDSDGHPTFKNGERVILNADSGKWTFRPFLPFRIVAVGGELLRVLLDGSSKPYGKPQALVSQASYDAWAASIAPLWADLSADEQRTYGTGSVFARHHLTVNGMAILDDGQPNDAPDIIDKMFGALVAPAAEEAPATKSATK